MAPTSASSTDPGGLGASPSTPRSFNYPKATKAVNYLEDKGIRRTLSEMTKALLEQRPEDVTDFMVNYLRPGSLGSSKPMEPVADLIESPAGVACAFLELQRNLQRNAVKQLVDLSAPSFNGTTSFYSAPGGRGRYVKVVGQDSSEQDSFILVSSSSASAAVGDVACGPHDAIMKSAVADGVAVSGNLVAAAVRTTAGLEGLLLAEIPINTNGGNLTSASVGYKYGTFALMPMVRLWALILGERMESIFWRLDAQEARATLQCMQQNLRDIVERQDTGFDPDHAKLVANLPSQVLQGCVNSDRVALWVYDASTDELILNNTGHLDGSRVSASSSVVGEVIKSGVGGRRRPIYMADVDEHKRRKSFTKTNLEPASSLSVPVDFSEVGAEEEAGLAVVQFTLNKETCKSITHFDLAHAERLSKSCLPLMLQVRQCFLQIMRAGRERHHLETVREAMNHASTVTDVVQVVEERVNQLLECERTTLFFVDEEAGKIWAPPSKAVPKGIMVGIKEGLVGHIVQLGTDAIAKGEQECTMLINDPKSCPYWKGDIEKGFVTRNMLATAVISGGLQDKRRVVGVLQVLNKLSQEVAPEVCVDETHASSFSDNDLKLLRPIGKLVGMHLHRLTLDMMWSRALMEGGLDLDGVEDLHQAARPLILSEYFPEQEESHMTVTQVQRSTGFFKRASDLCETTPSSEVPIITEIPDYGQVDNWRVDYWALKEAEQFHILRRAMELSGVAPGDRDSEIDVSAKVLYNYFLAVKGNYRDNPYHGFNHAMSTVHYSFMVMKAGGMMDMLKAHDKFAILLGALCHDIDHRGRNTAFEVSTRSELALRYNDSSPLENHSAARLFEIAWGREQDQDCNIFRHFDGATYSMVRQRLVAAILATDMKFHGDHVKLLGNFKLEKSAETNDYPPDQLQFLVEMAVHTADIANTCMPQDISARWGKVIVEEFTAQTSHERQLGLPVTAFMDGLSDKVACAKSQIGFMNFVVQPYLAPIVSLFPGLAELKTNMERNRSAQEAIRDS